MVVDVHIHVVNNKTKDNGRPVCRIVSRSNQSEVCYAKVYLDFLGYLIDFPPSFRLGPNRIFKASGFFLFFPLLSRVLLRVKGDAPSFEICDRILPPFTISYKWILRKSYIHSVNYTMSSHSISCSNILRHII